MNGQLPSDYELAVVYYNLPSDKRGYMGVADKLGLISPGMTAKDAERLEDAIGKAIRRHERKLVYHQPLRGDGKELLPRKFDMEIEIRSRFALRDCIVVDISSLTPADHGDAQEGWCNDDHIHRRLGAWGGRVLATCLRPADNCGVGGGRGPANTALGLAVSKKIRYTCKIVSLTGQISASNWCPGDSGDPLGAFLDADNVASSLQGRLGTRGEVCAVGRSITEKGKIDTNHVAVALVGIGALGGGHRLKHFKELEDVAKVRDLLGQINGLAEAIEAKHRTLSFCAVGDVCNWYFVVDEAESYPECKALRKAVANLNAQFLNTTPESLAQICRRGMVLAVAGGPHKVAAMRHVLRKNREIPWITHLVTDHQSAASVIQSSIS